jgi:hypothetical protein
MQWKIRVLVFFSQVDAKNKMALKIKYLCATLLLMQEMWNPGSSVTGDLISFGEPATPMQQQGGQAQPGTGTGTAAAATSHLSQQDQVMTDAISKSVDLGHIYRQCKAARSTGLHVTETAFSTEQGFTVDEPLLDRIGNLDYSGDAEVSHTFHGARISKGGKIVNEAISISFDPRSFNCLGCKKTHNILNGTPVTICFTDQNFVPFIQDSAGACLGIVRVEDAALSDLVDICFEMLDQITLPAGSILMFGSASHLFRAGVSIYAQNLIECETRIGSRWRNVHYCPLIPIVRESCPGSLARELVQLASWIIRVYSTKIEGVTDCWEGLLIAVQSQSIGSLPIHNGELVKVPLPATYSSSTLRPHCFRFNSSCPILLNGCDPRVANELVRVLVTSLKQKFAIALNPDLLVNRSYDASPDTRTFSNHVVVLGASNGKRLVPVLERLGLTVTDLTRSGWLATEENISALGRECEKLNLPPGFGIIIDLLSNATFRYEQFDGSTALPYRDGTGYHYAGKITVCPDPNFKHILGMLQPIFLSAQNNFKVVFPPMPRYLGGGCCKSPAHGTNVRDENYAVTLLEKLTNLRGTLKKSLGEMGVQNFWVLDGLAAMQGIAPPEKRGSNRDSLPDLLSSIGPDNVHLTPKAYQNIAKTVGQIFVGLRDGKLGKNSVASSVSGPEGSTKPKPASHFWRGFNSPVGSPGVAVHPAKKSGSRFHPYQRGKSKKF